MKLNPDCIRDILMFVENETTLYDPVEISPEDIPEFFNSYSSEEVMYHIKQCELSNLILIPSWYLDGGCIIAYLLPEGHQFIANIRNDTNWNKTKEIAKSVGSSSLDIIKEIAANVVSSLIQSYLGQ